MTFGPEPATAGFAAGPRGAHRSTPPDRPQQGRLAAAAGSAMVRVLGVYIAAAAGAVQLLDILVDRFGWSERIFLTAIIVGVAGMPITAAAAMIRDAVREERQPAPRRRSAGVPPEPVSNGAAAAARSVGASAAERYEPARRRQAGSAAPADAGAYPSARGDAASTDSALADEPVALASRIELALSHRRVAAAHLERADATTAAAHFDVFAAEAARVRDQLTALIEEARVRAGAARNQTQAE